MKQGYLSQYFKGIAFKTLSAVEANLAVSHQHEFNGVGELKQLLGESIPKKIFNTKFIYLSDDDAEPIEADATLTWYDARENHPKRSENRLYFPTTLVSQNASEGDLLLIAKKPDETLLAIIAEADSTIANQLLWLMGEGNVSHPSFSVKGEIENDQVKLDFISRLILEQVGIEAGETDESLLDQMLARFGNQFPNTLTLSSFVQETLALNPLEDPDSVLVAWYEREFILFRTLEEHFLSSQISDGFQSVQDFLQLSLSVQNRRKSRAGSALQHHLAPIFKAHNLVFDTHGMTENKQKPDFLFPSADAYHDESFATEKLILLGAKTSCKDRWRQVLAEASRIKNKHLCTLEAGISENQTNQMLAHQLQLVIPQKYHDTYTLEQQKTLLNLSGFIAFVKTKQK